MYTEGTSIERTLQNLHLENSAGAVPSLRMSSQDLALAQHHQTAFPRKHVKAHVARSTRVAANSRAAAGAAHLQPQAIRTPTLCTQDCTALQQSLRPSNQYQIIACTLRHHSCSSQPPTSQPRIPHSPRQRSPGLCLDESSEQRPRHGPRGMAAFLRFANPVPRGLKRRHRTSRGNDAHELRRRCSSSSADCVLAAAALRPPRRRGHAPPAQLKAQSATILLSGPCGGSGVHARAALLAYAGAVLPQPAPLAVRRGGRGARALLRGRRGLEHAVAGRGDEHHEPLRDVPAARK